MEQQPLSNPEKVPRLGQCYLCRAWQLESKLQAIEVPDQTGYVKKLACQGCLKAIFEENPSGP